MIFPSVYDLYSCYEYLDTNSDQDYRNTLYGNLKYILKTRSNTETMTWNSSGPYISHLCANVNMGEK